MLETYIPERTLASLKAGIIGVLIVWVAGGMTALTHPVFNPWYLGIERYIGSMAVLSGIVLGAVLVLSSLANE